MDTRLIGFLLGSLRWWWSLDHTKLWTGCLVPLWRLVWHHSFFVLFFLVNVKLIKTSVWLGMVHSSCFKLPLPPTMLKLLLSLCLRNMIRYLMYVLSSLVMFLFIYFLFVLGSAWSYVMNTNSTVTYIGHRRRFFGRLYRVWRWWCWQGIFHG